MATDLERLAISLEASVKRFENEMRRARTSNARAMADIEARTNTMTRRVNKAFAQVSARSLMGGLAGGFLGGFAGGISAGNLVPMSRQIIAEASNIAKAADRVGLATDAFQALTYSFGQAGVSAGDFEKSMEQFARRIGEAESKAGGLAKVLAANGIAIRDADGNMRPVLDLLKDYADLMQRAEGPQQRLALAQEAFGKGGATMVNALKDGAASIDQMIAAAKEAGVVLDEDLLRSAERIDDQFDTLTKTIGTQFKRAVLSAAMGMEALVDSFRRLENRTLIAPLMDDLASAQAQRARIAEDIARQEAALSNSGVWGRIAGRGADKRLDQSRALLAEAEKRETTILNRIAELEQQERAKSARPPGGVEMPESGANRERATRAIREQRDAVAELIKHLEEELSLVGASDVEREVSNALRRAGADATDAQKLKIEELVRALHAEEEAHRAANDAADYFGSTAYSALRDMISGTRSAEEAVQRLVESLAEAALQAALLGKGPLAGLFGSGGGLLSNLFTGLGKGFSSGGYTGSGGKYEPAGVVHKGEYVFDKAAVARLGVGNLEALRRGRGFADGGYVDMPRIPAPVQPRGGGVSINIVNENGSDVQMDARQAPGGGWDVAGFVRDVVNADLMKGGSIARQIQGMYGLSRMGRR